jgi:hypothetical protein
MKDEREALPPSEAHPPGVIPQSIRKSKIHHQHRGRKKQRAEQYGLRVQEKLSTRISKSSCTVHHCITVTVTQAPAQNQSNPQLCIKTSRWTKNTANIRKKKYTRSVAQVSQLFPFGGIDRFVPLLGPIPILPVL